MAVITSFPSTEWRITLSRVEDSGELALVSSDFTIQMTTVMDISGTRLMRVLTLGMPVAMLMPSMISITSHGDMRVVSTTNQLKEQFLNNIRDLLDLGLTADGLPDDKIDDLVFLRAAELDVYDLLGLTDETYDMKAMTDSAFAERVRIAVMYRTAAKLLYSFPQIVSEATLSLSTRYREIDIDNKINFWLNLSNKSVEPDIPDDVVVGSGVVIAESVTRTFTY